MLGVVFIVWLPAFCVFIHLLTDRRLDCFWFCPPRTELLWNLHECPSVCGRVSPSVLVSAWAWSSRVVWACVTARSVVFRSGRVIFYFRQHSAGWGLRLLGSLASTWHCQSFLVEAVLVEGLWRLSVVLVCISLLTNDESSVFLSVFIGQMNLFSVEMPFLIFGEFFLKMKVLSWENCILTCSCKRSYREVLVALYQISPVVTSCKTII